MRKASPFFLFQAIFFDYERYVIRSNQQQALEDNRQFLLQHPDMRVVIEGYCDDRGSTEYNLASLKSALTPLSWL